MEELKPASPAHFVVYHYRANRPESASAALLQPAAPPASSSTVDSLLFFDAPSTQSSSSAAAQPFDPFEELESRAKGTASVPLTDSSRSRDDPFSPAELGVSEFLALEATSNDDFSLSIVRSSMPLDEEQDLRKVIVKRLSRGCVYSGSGNLLVLEPTWRSSAAMGPAAPERTTSCFYFLVRDAKDDIKSPEGGRCSSDYVICLLREFEGKDVDLDLFRPELDAYCNDLVARGIFRGTDINSPPFANDPLTVALSEWYDVAVMYLSRCASLFAERLDVVIHAALVGRTINVVGCSEAQCKEVADFITALSLSSILQLERPKGASGSTPTSPTPLSLPPTTLTISNGDFSFSQ
jgi:hypothetical protein